MTDDVGRDGAPRGGRAMSRAFLYGPLCWPDLLEIVAGRPVACDPAILPGAGVRSGEDGRAVLGEGDGARGLLTEPLDPEVRARIDWYEAAFGATPEPAPDLGPDVVTHRAGDAGAGQGGWDLDAWIGAQGARAAIAAAEILRLRDSVPAGDMPARRRVAEARAHGIAQSRDRLRTATFGGTTPAEAIDVTSVAYPYEGFHRVEEWLFDHPRFDGGRSGPIRRALSHVTDAATVLPYDAVRDRVLVVEQIRVGPMSKGDPRPWLLEPVAGLIDAGETAENTALRELQEEAGLTAGPAELHLVGRYYPSPGGLAQVLTSFVALCDLPDDAAGLHGLEEEGEDIRGHLVPLPELAGMLDSGEAANAPLIVSAQWLMLNRDRLRAVG